ncbi:MAG: 2'-5' RNA ligase family protein [Arachnia sp.]
MPEAYLHTTVQRLAQFDADVTAAELTQLGDALNRCLANVHVFELDLAAPQASGFAIECLAGPSPAWNALVAAVRQAVGQTWGPELPDPPFGPHVSLAYATGDVDDSEIARRLADATPVGRLRIDEVSLVTVTVRPEVGTFDFAVLANFSLAERPRQDSNLRATD